MITRYFTFTGEGALAEYPNAVEFFTHALSLTEGCSWIDCCDPERIELEDLAVNFNLHRLSVDDCFEENPIPKIDIFPEYCALVFHDVAGSDGIVSLTAANYFVGRGFLLSVRRAASEGAHPIGKTVERLRRNGLSGGAPMLLHALLDETVDRVFPALEELTEKVADMEDGAIAGEGSLDPGALSDMRKSLLGLRKSLNYERELVSRIRRRESAVFGDAVLPYFGDLGDHIASYLDLAESSREAIGNLVQMNLAMSSNAMAEASNRMNRSVGRLTFITVIFMPLTLLSGILGMSEFTMMTGQGNWKLSYPLLLLGMLGIAAATAGILRRLDDQDGGD